MELIGNSDYTLVHEQRGEWWLSYGYGHEPGEPHSQGDFCGRSSFGPYATEEEARAAYPLAVAHHGRISRAPNWPQQG